MTIYCTMWGFPPEVRIVDRRQLGVLRTLTTLLRSVRPGDAVLLNGALGAADRYVDQLIGLALRYLRPSVVLVLADATWAPRSTPGEARHPLLARLVESWNKLLVRLLNGPCTHFCFLARSECVDVVAEARLDPARVHFTPFCTTIDAGEQLERLQELAVQPLNYVFSGGNASRDYSLLVEAVTGLDVPVRIATTRPLGVVPPPNVEAAPVSPQEFLDLLARSRAVVLPLSTATRRSVGQQTYLNAMLLRKPVVVTDAPGVRDYLTDGVDALVVAAEPAAIRAALEWLFDPGNAEEVRALTERGWQLARGMDEPSYNRRLIELARVAARGRSRPSGRS
jgi:glycosyltransferase involved in cell wall biosynthesis